MVFDTLVLLLGLGFDMRLFMVLSIFHLSFDIGFSMSLDMDLGL